MSEYKTLSEWFGDATKADGGKFVDYQDRYFEPVFRDSNGDWIGFQDNGKYIAYHNKNIKFRLWHPPKKKIKRWKYAFRNPGEYWEESKRFFTEENVELHLPENLCEIKKLLYTETEFEE